MSEKKRNIASISNQCVACGCCVKVCPLGAVAVPNGIQATIDSARCVGCGKCAAICPASVITIIERPASMMAEGRAM